MSTVAPLDTVPETAPSLVVTSLLAVTAGMMQPHIPVLHLFIFHPWNVYIRMLMVTRRSPEHKASECPNPRTAEGVECRRCNDGKQAQHTVTQPPPPPANAVLVTGLLDDNLF